MNLHLGCGYKKLPNFINIDFDPECEPDKIQDLTKPWDFPDNSVDHIVTHHLLEHLGDPDFFNFLKEMYRVSKNNTIIEIVVPHHRHDCFLNDPTHRRPITIEGLRLFSKKHNKYCKEIGDGSSRLGIYYNVDFEIVDFNFNIDPFYHNIRNNIKSEEDERNFQQLLREKNNTIVDVEITMIAVK